MRIAFKTTKKIYVKKKPIFQIGLTQKKNPENTIYSCIFY